MPLTLPRTGSGFSSFVDRLNLKQPPNGIAHSAEEARAIVEKIGLPVVIRPSYVLGGRAMEVVHAIPDLERTCNRRWWFW